MSADFVVIGDVILDHFIRIPEAGIVAKHAEKNSLEIPFPTKVALEEPPSHLPGGNAFTVAMVLAKLDVKTHLYTEMGSDSAGQQILNKLISLGIDTELVKMELGAQTSSSTILSDGTDRVIFSYHYPRNYKLPELPNPKYVYLTSIGEDDQALFAQVLAAKKSQNFQLIFSPGSKQLAEDFSEISPVFSETDILILNQDEAKRILGSKDSGENVSEEELVRGLQAKGPKSVIMTKGSKGSVAIVGDEITKIGAHPVDVVETTGAGDTFAATASAALFLGKPIAEALAWGAFNAASVVQQIGCEQSLRTRESLENLTKHKLDELV